MRTWILIALALVAAGGAAAQNSTVVGEDTAITARIETMFLLSDHLNPFNINTTTQDGAVTLTGGVNDEVQRKLAEDLARSANGVVSVNNQIAIVPPAMGPKEQRSFRRKVVDKTTDASVRGRLLYHQEFKGLKIGVETVNGITTLSGVINSEEQKQRISDIVLQTRGVGRVVNNLTVRRLDPTDDLVEHLGRQTSDEWLEKRVEGAIALNRHLSIREMNVEVDDGIVILSGLCDSQTEKDLAGAVTGSIAGVQEVRNDISIREGAMELSAPLAAPLPTATASTPTPAPPSPAAPPGVSITANVPEPMPVVEAPVVVVSEPEPTISQTELPAPESPPRMVEQEIQIPLESTAIAPPQVLEAEDLPTVEQP